MTVEEYLEQAPEPQRTTLNELRATLRQILPDATETISYGKPAFKVSDRAVAGYAYYKDHCSYFPHSGTVLTELADEIDGHEWSIGTLKFPVDQPLPRELVTRLVEVPAPRQDSEDSVAAPVESDSPALSLQQKAEC